MILTSHAGIICLGACAIVSGITATKTCYGRDDDPCHCELKNGSGVIDIRSYGENTYMGLPWIADTCGPWGENGGQFSYNPCIPFTYKNFNGEEAELAMALMMSDNDPPDRFDIGRQSRAMFVNTPDGLQIRYKSLDGVYESVVSLYCLPQHGTDDFYVVDKRNQTTFVSILTPAYEHCLITTHFQQYFEWIGVGVCPVPSSRTHFPTWLSHPGIVALLIITIAVVLYLVIGLIYKRSTEQGPSEGVTSCVTQREPGDQNATISPYDVLDDEHPAVNIAENDHSMETGEQANFCHVPEASRSEPDSEQLLHNNKDKLVDEGFFSYFE